MEFQQAIEQLNKMNLATAQHVDAIDVPVSLAPEFFANGTDKNNPTELAKTLQSQGIRAYLEPDYRVRIGGFGNENGFEALKKLAENGATFRGADKYRSDRPDRISFEDAVAALATMLEGAEASERAPSYTLTFPYERREDLLKSRQGPSPLRFALQEKGIHPFGNGARVDITGREALVTLAEAGLEQAATMLRNADERFRNTGGFGDRVQQERAGGGDRQL